MPTLREIGRFFRRVGRAVAGGYRGFRIGCRQGWRGTPIIILPPPPVEDPSGKIKILKVMMNGRSVAATFTEPADARRRWEHERKMENVREIIFVMPDGQVRGHCRRGEDGGWVRVRNNLRSEDRSQ